MPEVSVIMPAFNPGRLIDAAIESVVTQTFADWELIVVDDGSNADLSGVLKIDRRVRYIRQQNAGPASARNAGITESTGSLIAFLDADDLWMPGKLQVQVEQLAEYPDAAFCHTQFVIISEEGHSMKTGWSRPVESYFELLQSNCVLTSTVMVRRSCLDEVGLFDTEFRAAEDIDLFLRISRQFPSVFIEQVLTSHRWTPGGLSRSVYAHYCQYTAVLKKHLDWANSKGDVRAVDAAKTGLRSLRRGQVCTQLDLSRLHAAAHRPLKFIRCVVNAMRVEPGYVLSSIGPYLIERLNLRGPNSPRN